MGYQGFSPKLELAKALAGAKRSPRPPSSEADKDRKKQMDRERADKLLAENLAQRVLVESRRA